MMDWHLEPLQPADFAQVRALWDSCAGVRADETEGEIARYLERNPGLSCVARAGERMLGAVLCGHDGRRGYLYHLSVAGDSRGQGIARALVARSLSQLQSLGIRRCTLFVLADNDAGVTFWKQLGWRERIDLRTMAIDLALLESSSLKGNPEQPVN